MKTTPVNFENIHIRRVYDEKAGTWNFSVVDIIRALLQQPDFQTARKYWNKLKERLGKEGSETVTNCQRLKMVAEDGKLIEEERILLIVQINGKVRDKIEIKSPGLITSSFSFVTLL